MEINNRNECSDANLVNEATSQKQSPRKFCKYCGKPLQPEASFCSYCGKPQKTLTHPQDGKNDAPTMHSRPERHQPRVQPIKQSVIMVENERQHEPTNAPSTTQNSSTTIIVQGSKSNGLGTAGFVLALLALLLCWIPVLNFILWILGLLFSLIGVFKQPRGFAIAGLIISFIGIIITLSVVGTIIGLAH